MRLDKLNNFFTKLKTAIIKKDFSDIAEGQMKIAPRNIPTIHYGQLYGEYSTALDWLKLNDYLEISASGFVLLTEKGKRVKEFKKKIQKKIIPSIPHR